MRYTLALREPEMARTAMSRRSAFSTQGLVPHWTTASQLAAWAHLAVVGMAFCAMLTAVRALRARRHEHDVVIARLKSYCAQERASFAASTTPYRTARMTAPLALREQRSSHSGVFVLARR